ncbi:MAG: hypothetical protein ACRDZ8_02165 [Acidimicrobiales bacterium]
MTATIDSRHALVPNAVRCHYGSSTGAVTKTSGTFFEPRNVFGNARDGNMQAQNGHGGSARHAVLRAAVSSKAGRRAAALHRRRAGTALVRDDLARLINAVCASL